MQDEISFGVWLRKQRRASDLSRQALADQVGCAEVTLRRIEAGTLKPSKELAGILLEKLGIPDTERSQWISFARGLSGFPTQPSPISNKPKSNLRTSLTTFIGREKEQSDVIQLLTKRRLVTLTGSGGVGKTRLSIRVGKQALGNYVDGVWLVELAPIFDPSLIPHTTALTLGLREDPNRRLLDVLCDYLQEKRMLLLLDNCEHVLDACAQLIDVVLKACPHLKILATSREPLNITGEAIYRVPSLGLPNLEQILKTFRNYESIQLFEERAQLVQFDFSLTMENAVSVAQICQRLDGIPLAIELAAAKVAVFSTEQIAKQLNESLNLLREGSRTALPRHQTLRASINWSWDLLTDSEQRLMRQLSVFAGGWTLDAVQSVCDGDVLELIHSLVKKSLIMINQQVGRETRYIFHETIRQYAHEKLLESGENKQIRSSHLDYFLKLAKQAEPELYGASQIEWLHKLEAENENIRAALEWSLQGDLTSGQELAGALWRFWIVNDNLTEGYEWMERMLRLSSGDKSFVRAKLLAVQGDMAYCLGYSEKAEKVSEESITLFRELGYEASIALPLCTLGRIAGSKTDYEKMKQLLNKGLDISRRAGDRWGVFYALSILGTYIAVYEDFLQGQKILEECLLIGQEIGDREGFAQILFFLAGRIAMQGNFARAMKMYEEVLEFEKLLSRRFWTTEILTEMGHLASYMGDYEKGRRLLQEAMELYEKIGDRAGIGRSLRYLGWTARLEGDYLKAHALYAQDLHLSLGVQEPHVASCLIHIGSLEYAKGFPEKFVRLLGAAEKILPEIRGTLLPVFRIETEKLIESTRVALGEAAFLGAYEEGKSMTLDQAVAYALGES